MSVEIASGIASRLRRSYGHVVLQLRVQSDSEMALNAVSSVVDHLRAVAIGYVSGPGKAPDGPFFAYELKGGPIRSDDVPQLVREAAVEAGVRSGVIDVVIDHGIAQGLAEDYPDWVDAIGHLVPGRSPSGFEEFVAGLAMFVADAPGDLWVLGAGSFELSVDRADLAATMLTFLDGEGSQSVGGIAVDPDAGAAGMCLLFRSGRVSAVVGHSAHPPDRALPPIIEDAWSLLRNHAQLLDYAFLCPETSWWSFRNGFVYREWNAEPGADQLDGPLGADRQISIADETAIDAFPRQILGPRHVAQLSSLPVGLALEPLKSGRVDLRIGEVEDWFSDEYRRTPTYQAATKVMQPLLRSTREVIQTYGR